MHWDQFGKLQICAALADGLRHKNALSLRQIVTQKTDERTIEKARLDTL